MIYSDIPQSCALTCECYATFLDPNRVELYQDVFPDGRIPLMDPNPRNAPDPKTNLPSMFYRTDVGRLGPTQKRIFCELMASKWTRPVAEIAKDLEDPKHGIPLKADTLKIVICSAHAGGMKCPTCGNDNRVIQEQLEKPVFCSFCGNFLSAPYRYFM